MSFNYFLQDKVWLFRKFKYFWFFSRTNTRDFWPFLPSGRSTIHLPGPIFISNFKRFLSFSTYFIVIMLHIDRTEVSIIWLRGSNCKGNSSSNFFTLTFYETSLEILTLLKLGWHLNYTASAIDWAIVNLTIIKLLAQSLSFSIVTIE